MKYIDSEKLIAEIERRIEETKSMKPSFDQFWAGQISAFKGVKTIINSLQQEQPEVDLEKVLSGFTGYYAHENSGEYPSAIDIARYFAQWGATHLKK